MRTGAFARADAFETVMARLGAYFVTASPLYKAASDLAARLRDMGIDYAIAGALGLAAHGVVRATEDIDVLIARDDLERFKTAWRGRGYVDLRPGGKGMRDTANDVKVDFLIAGDYPGDGKPKPVSFPLPAAVSTDASGFRVVALPRLIELKLASGMTAPHRLQDLADVLRVIETLRLPRAFGDGLDPYVRAKFDELWQTAQHAADDY